MREIFRLQLHKRIRTKINYKGSVAQDMDYVNDLTLYIVFWIIENG